MLVAFIALSILNTTKYSEYHATVSYENINIFMNNIVKRKMEMEKIKLIR